MDAWWVRDEPQAAAPAIGPRAVAYYRHSAQGRQENSIPIQREQVEKWAAEHGIRIIKEFMDHGISGLSIEHRDAFSDMLENWVKKRDDFEYVLVLDVSRWGRFQDTDLSATYSALCTQHGKKVVYTSLGLPKQDDPLHSMLVGFERYRAAQYSRELSDKVWKGAKKVVEQGFRAGGTAPYGLYRLLLDKDRQPVQVLRSSERKFIQNQRVTLIPGDPEEIAVVRRIFEESARQQRTPREIADGLNRDLIPSPGGTTWNRRKVRELLKDKLYIGSLFYNRTTAKLQSPARRLPREQWIESASAFPGIVSKELFDQAQAVLQAQMTRYSRENLLRHIHSLYERSGTLTRSLMLSRSEYPGLETWRKKFGGVANAFQTLFPEVHREVTQEVRRQVSALVGPVEEHADFLILGRRLTVLVQPSIPVPFGYRSYWPFTPDPRNVIDITLGVPLSGTRDPKILGYFAFPRLLCAARQHRVHGPMDSRIELFGHPGLDFLKDLLS